MIFASLVMSQHPIKITPHVQLVLVIHTDRLEAETRVRSVSVLQKHFYLVSNQDCWIQFKISDSFCFLNGCFVLCFVHFSMEMGNLETKS